MAVDETNTKTATTYAHLTVSSCVGCHVENTTAIPAPKIDGEEGVDMTAGGTFDVAEASTDSKRHDVMTLAAWNVAYDGEGTATATPGNSVGSDQTVGLAELTCAGTKGCHGNSTVADNDAAIAGFHHGGVSGWRYLQNAADQASIDGKGSVDWEKGGAKDTNHNIYSADTSTGISALCANCHGQFHSTTYTGSSPDWIRHPTDNLIPDSWDTAGTGIVTVDLDRNPFAFTDLTVVSTTNLTNYAIGSAATAARVACISCHRAHGSKHDDILRFAYNTQDAGGGATYGCLGCHTKQR